MPTVSKLPEKIALIGPYGAGKDHVLAQFRYEVRAFSEPLKHIARHCFGTDDKKVAGMREFLQTIGQWGRGVRSEEYPLSTNRLLFEERITGPGDSARKLRSELRSRYAVDVSRWGKSDIWVRALVARLNAAQGKVGVSGLRFLNELAGVRSGGVQAFFVYASPAELKIRRTAQGVATTKAGKDPSERLATAILAGLRTGVVEYENPNADDAYSGPLSGLVDGVVWNSADPVPELSVPVFVMPR